MTPGQENELSFQVLGDFGQAEPVWRDLLERSPTSIYQTPEFVRSWADACGDAKARMRFILLLARGKPALLLPLTVQQGRVMSVAAYPCGKHSNFNMPIYDPAIIEKMSPALLPLLSQAAASAGIDALALANQPDHWRGIAHPLASVRHTRSPSYGYALTLEKDANALMQRIASKDRRKKLRQKQRWLAELGAVSYVEASDRATMEAMLDEYLAQKGRQFEAMGVRDAFADAETRKWLLAMATMPPTSTTPLKLFGLRLDDRYIAIWGVGLDGSLVSGMMTSYFDDARIARTSPGELLLEWLVQRLCAEGRMQFDFGVGEAHYKTLWSDVTIPLFDSYIGVTLKGRLLAGALTARSKLKRKIKQSPRLLAVAKRMQRVRG